MNSAKIRLSQKEMELVSDDSWILTKNKILDKAKLLLGNLLEEQQAVFGFFKNYLPEELTTVPPKISKGENYRGLPYLILDYPRIFTKENTFAIRTMFWWGNFFSITLHLSGNYKRIYEKKIIATLSDLQNDGFFICINEDQWEHHFEDSNYRHLTKMNKEKLIQNINEAGFLKLSQKIPLQQWDDVITIATGIFHQLLKRIST